MGDEHIFTNYYEAADYRNGGDSAGTDALLGVGLGIAFAVGALIGAAFALWHVAEDGADQQRAAFDLEAIYAEIEP